MTAMAGLAPDRDAGLRPVPWRRMVWVTWRQHRFALAGLAALYGVAAISLVAGGMQMRDAHAAVTLCRRPAGSPGCQQLAAHFLNTYVPAALGTLSWLQLLPAVVGMFVGAPLLARELETGTFRYAWTQGFGRTRLVVAKFAMLGVPVTVVAGAFSILISWYIQPLTNHVGDSPALDVVNPAVFDLLGVVFAAWTLMAFAIGAFAGAVVRRAAPAMVATLAVWAGLLLATGGVLRQRYLAPMTAQITNPNGVPSQRIHGLVLEFEWARGGKPVPLSRLNEVLRPVHVRATGAFDFEPTEYRPPPVDPFSYLMHRGYVLQAVYLPDDRFWTYQWIEAGWLLALSFLLLAATVWLVRRRAA